MEIPVKGMAADQGSEYQERRVAGTSPGIGPRPVLAPEGNLVDEVEREALRKYLTRQFITLTKRHSPEDAILVRVISDYHQYAVLQAKEGRLEAARSTLQTLEDMAKLDESELMAVHRVSALPAWALVHWYEGDHDEAIRLLKGALDACLELVTEFGHDYLTAKRIHLAANIARVWMSRGSFDRALACVISLKAVVGGRRDRWLFAGKDSLDVPLRNPERIILEEQLRRIGSMATKGRRVER